MDAFLKNNIFANLEMLETQNSCHFRKRRGPTNDEDPFKEILKIVNMEPISTKKHEIDIRE